MLPGSFRRCLLGFQFGDVDFWKVTAGLCGVSHSQDLARAPFGQLTAKGGAVALFVSQHEQGRPHGTGQAGALEHQSPRTGRTDDEALRTRAEGLPNRVRQAAFRIKNLCWVDLGAFFQFRHAMRKRPDRDDRFGPKCCQEGFEKGLRLGRIKQKHPGMVADRDCCRNHHQVFFSEISHQVNGARHRSLGRLSAACRLLNWRCRST